MQAMTMVKAAAVAMLFGLFAHGAPAQTEQQIAEKNQLSERDWRETLDYCEWLLIAQYWIEHPDSEYAKQFFAELNLDAADDTAFRSVVEDFSKRHNLLVAESVEKLNSPDWTPEVQRKLIEDTVSATNEVIQTLKSSLSAEGMKKVDAMVL